MMISGEYKVAGRVLVVIAAFIIPGKLVHSLSTAPSSNSIFDEHAIVKLENSSHHLNDTSLAGLKLEVIDTGMLNRKANPLVVAEVASMVYGFVTGILTIYDFIKGKTGPKQTSLDDVMEVLEKEFGILGSQLSAIFNGVSDIQLAGYKDVEIAVRKSLHAMKFNRPVVNDEDANTLYTKLDLLMDGMLGKTFVLPNILKVLTAKHHCNYNAVYKDMNRLINLVNIGAGGLSYYYVKLNQEDIGKRLLERLSEKRDLVENQIEPAEKECVTDAVHPKVEEMLASMQDSSACTVVKKIHDQFVNVYKSKIWSWYAAWDFDPNGKWTDMNSLVRLDKYVEGMVENGGWKVYWTARRKPANWDAEGTLKVRSDGVKTAVKPDAKDCNAGSTIYYLIKSIVGFPGKEPRNFRVVCHAPKYACGFGNDLYYERFKGHWTIDVLVN